MYIDKQERLLDRMFAGCSACILPEAFYREINLHQKEHQKGPPLPTGNFMRRIITKSYGQEYGKRRTLTLPHQGVNLLHTSITRGLLGVVQFMSWKFYLQQPQRKEKTARKRVRIVGVYCWQVAS